MQIPSFEQEHVTHTAPGDYTTWFFLAEQSPMLLDFKTFFSKSSINRKPPKHDKVAKVFLPCSNIFLRTWTLKWYPNIFSKVLAQKVWSLRGKEPFQVQSGNPAACVLFYCFLLWWENIKYSLETKSINLPRAHHQIDIEQGEVWLTNGCC